MHDSYEILDASRRFLLDMTKYNLGPSYRVPEHSHHYLEMSYINSGKGKYNIDGDTFDVQQGDIFIINNIEKHVLTVEPPNNLVNIVIHFEPKFIWSQIDSSFDSHYLKFFFNKGRCFCNKLGSGNPAALKIAKLFGEIEEEFRGAQYGFEHMVKVRLMDILVLTTRHFANDIGDLPKSQQNSHGFEFINSVLDFINDNLDNDLSLGELANIAHLNSSYFCTLFKKYNGINPTQYIRSKRIEKSIEYLKFSDKSITEIAGLCGFNNMTTFYDSFRKITSSNPSAYRKK